MKRILVQKIEIGNQRQYSIAMKNHYSKVRSLKVSLGKADVLTSRYQDDENRKLKKMVSKVFKMKIRSKLEIDSTLSALEKQERSKLRSIMKKHSNIRSLILTWSFEQTVLRFSYLKFMKRLVELKLIPNWDWKEHLPSVQKNGKLGSFFNLKRSRLTSFSLKYNWHKDQPFLISKVPSTLKKLELRINSAKEQFQIYSNLKNIQHLSLILLHRKDMSIWDSLTLNLKSIISLDLKIPYVMIKDERIIPKDFSLRMPNLKHIQLKFRSSCSNAFLEQFLQNKNIETFSFKTSSQDQENLAKILECLDTWKNLINLKLKIYKDWKEENEISFIEELPRKLADLTQLRNLELHLLLNDLYLETLPQPIQISFDFLTKLPCLTKLKIKSRIIEPGVLAEILKISCHQLPALKNLNINLELYCLVKDSCNDLIRLLQNSNKLRVLKLRGLIISNPTFLREITRCIASRRILEKFTFGDLLENISAECFFDFLSKILCTRGLKQFSMSERRLIEERDRGENDMWNKLGEVVQKAKKTNPELNEVEFGDYAQSNFE